MKDIKVISIIIKEKENEIDNKDIEKTNKDSNKISEEELNIFNTKIHSIQKGVNTLKSKFGSLLEKMKQEDYELQYGLSFFEAKQDMMIMYITNLLNYCYTKISGKESIQGMPFITDNIKIASLIERVKVIEMKLQHLINKTININNKDKNNIESVNEMDFKPKILSIYNNKDNDDNRGDNESDNSDEENEKEENKEKEQNEEINNNKEKENKEKDINNNKII